MNIQWAPEHNRTIFSSTFVVLLSLIKSYHSNLPLSLESGGVQYYFPTLIHFHINLCLYLLILTQQNHIQLLWKKERFSRQKWWLFSPHGSVHWTTGVLTAQYRATHNEDRDNTHLGAPTHKQGLVRDLMAFEIILNIQTYGLTMFGKYYLQLFCMVFELCFFTFQESCLLLWCKLSLYPNKETACVQ